jgi:hypothetical protein
MHSDHSDYARWFAESVGLPHDEDALAVGEYLNKLRGRSPTYVWKAFTSIARSVLEIVAWRKIA